MKNFYIASTFLVAFLLSACSSTGTGIPSPNGNSGAGNMGTGNTGTMNTIGMATNVGMNIFKTSVDAQCRNELEKQNAWRVARIAMSTEQEAAAKTKVCGCVSEQAPQHVTVVDLTNAAVDANYRQQLVVKVVAKSLQSCYKTLTSGS